MRTMARGGDQVVSAAIVASTTDASWAASLAVFLGSIGIRVHDVSSSESQLSSSGIVLVSRAALADHMWRAQVRKAQGRVLTVRLDDVAANDLPERLELIQWAELSPAQPAVTWAAVAAALQVDPEQLEELRQLDRLVARWLESGRSRRTLVSRKRRLKELVRVADSAVQSDDRDNVALLFLRSSASRVRRRRQVSLVALGVVGLVLTFVAGAALRNLAQLRRQQRAGEALALNLQDPGLTEQVEWSSLMAGATMLMADERDRPIARQLLYRNLSVP